MERLQRLGLFLGLVAILAACGSPAQAISSTPVSPDSKPAFPTPAAVFTSIPTRPPYGPGELVEYIAQTGDTLPALAAHFNTSEAEIRLANPIIPRDVSSMPPGMPMKIPIYYKPLWGTPYQIIPDSLYVNGPAQVGFDIEAFINSHPGWLNGYVEQLSDGPHSGADVIRIVSTNFSVSPRLLLAILEYFAQGLSNPSAPSDPYLLGYKEPYHKGVYMQLVWLANTLNNGYYGWRRGDLTEFEHPDGRIERPDPWQNAATVALQYTFSQSYSPPTLDQMIGPGGLAETYSALFGDPWANVQPHIPTSLTQPSFFLPFERGKSWNYTGGPHTGWGKGEPYAAIDFAPNGVPECEQSSDWVTAMAPGVIARSEVDGTALDLDGDGDERTGWVIFYLHLASLDHIPAGMKVNIGDRLGHPSCEGGEVTGTHVHIARKYNGEWIMADGPIPFNMEGWVVHNGKDAYKGTLSRFSQIVTASDKSEGKSLITADENNP